MALSRHIACLALLVAVGAQADEERAQVNYMLHCQGCHLPQAEGFAGKVPAIRNFAGYFLHSDAGREFLIRVPGVSQSALDDEQIAELMNWLLLRFSAGQLPQQYVPFTADEVAALRRNPEHDPATTRARILAELAAVDPALAQVLAEQ